MQSLTLEQLSARGIQHPEELWTTDTSRQKICAKWRTSVRLSASFDLKTKTERIHD